MSILEITAEQYHADTVSDTPSLSASIANLLCNRSPAHAYAAHPRLGNSLERRDQENFDIGTAAHTLILEGSDAVQIVDAPDWRTKAAKEARDEARSNGKIPLLAHVAYEVSLMVESVRRQLSEHDAQPPLFTAGLPEQTLVWEEPGGVTCRARLDWLRNDYATVDDLKTTSRSASPEHYSRALFNVGGDVQAAFYIRGVQELTGETPEFRWVVVETQPPYALSVVAPGPDILTIGRKKVEYAFDTWRRCLSTGVWPAYPTHVCYAELPQYEEARWLEKELREAA